MIELKTKRLADLTDAPYNPRRISDESLKALGASIDRFGIVEPVIWNKRTGHVVGGHQRLKVMRERGAKQTQVVVVDLPEAEEKALNVALNSPKLTGEFTPDLGDLLAEIKVELPDLSDALRFDDLEIPEFETEQPETVEDEAPEPPNDPQTKPGDLWTMGKHRVLCGDSTKAEDVERLMGGAKYDLLVTDPPYGVSYAAKNEFLNAVAPGNRIQEPIENDHKTPDEMSSFWCAVFMEIRQHAKPGASYYMTGPQGGDLLLLLQALSRCDFPLRHMLIWAKNNHVLGRSDYHYKHEPIIYGWVKGSHKFYGGHSETSLWEIDKPHRSELHPTTKPVELYSKAMRNSSREGDTIMDPFTGSGTAVVAAEQLGRACYGMEIEPKYCDVICQRYYNLTGDIPNRKNGKPFEPVAT